AIHRELRHPGHGRHWLSLVFSRSDKNRIDEVLGTQRGFAHQLPDFLVTTQSSRTVGGKVHTFSGLSPNFSHVRAASFIPSPGKIVHYRVNQSRNRELT